MTRLLSYFPCICVWPPDNSSQLNVILNDVHLYSVWSKKPHMIPYYFPFQNNLSETGRGTTSLYCSMALWCSCSLPSISIQESLRIIIWERKKFLECCVIIHLGIYLMCVYALGTYLWFDLP